MPMISLKRVSVSREDGADKTERGRNDAPHNQTMRSFKMVIVFLKGKTSAVINT